MTTQQAHDVAELELENRQLREFCDHLQAELSALAQLHAEVEQERNDAIKGYRALIIQQDQRQQ
jgi:hypothetical protein